MPSTMWPCWVQYGARSGTLVRWFSNVGRNFWVIPAGDFSRSSTNHRNSYKFGKCVKESANDGKDRMYRRAAAWYGKHIKQEDRKNKVWVEVLTNDARNRRNTKEVGELLVSSVADYMGSLSEHPELIRCSVARSSRTNRRSYSWHTWRRRWFSKG